MSQSFLGATWHCLPVIFTFLCAGSFIVLFGVAVYRLYFHPLARYPGPLIGRVTDSYSVYRAWEGKRHLDLYRLHRKYGAIVRYGPNNLSINDPAALPAIYGHKANVQKAHFYSAFPATKDAWSTHSAIDKALHARKRRVLSQGLSDNSMRCLEPYVLDSVRKFCDAIGDFASISGKTSEASVSSVSRGWSTPKDMGRWANYMSYDVLGDICYGESFRTLESPENRFALDLVATSSQFHYLNAQMPRLKRLGLDRLLFPDLRASRLRFMEYSRARLSARMALGDKADRKDIFHFLLNAKDPETGQGFGTKELWGESNVLLIAGSDTTSTAFSAAIFYLLHNQEHLARLTALVRKTFASQEDIVSGPALLSLKYLRACIDEAMRLSPPVPGLLPREVLGPEPLSITLSTSPSAIIKIPPGTNVGVPIYAVHRNSESFPEPDAYRPERWLASPNNSNSAVTQNRGVAVDAKFIDAFPRADATFCPFSIGPRGCIGRRIALMELTLALARMLWIYDLRLAPGGEGVGVTGANEYDLEDIFVAKKKGPVVQFRRRTDAF